MKKPLFFIVGAPKCGTTALYDYLQQHPDIWLPRKEIYFFGSDFTFRHTRPSLDYYLSLFENAPNSAKTLGEASVWYLYSQKAAQEIKAFQPNAKIIIMLRNPTQMLYSLHSQQLYAGNENINDFGQALAAETDRQQAKRIPPLIGCPYEALYYSQVPRYTEQIKRYWNEFGKENVKIILFDELIQNTSLVYTETLQFLGINTHFLPDFKQVNPNKTVRSKLWRDLLKKRPQWLIKTAKILIPSRQWRERIQQKLWAINTKKTDRPPMNPSIKQQLDKLFAHEIEQLSILLEKDLSHWN